MSPQEKDVRLINTWVLVHNKGKRLEMERERYSVSVEYFVGFFYVDRTAGTTINILSYCDVDGDQITFTKGPGDDNSRMMVRYTHAQGDDMQINILTDSQRIALALPDEPDWLVYYKVEGQEELDRIRKIQLLHPLRAPGFPDDIQFALIPPRDDMKVETVWGRILANPQENIYIVNLLNQPEQDFSGIKRGDYLAVEVKMATQGISSVCVGRVDLK